VIAGALLLLGVVTLAVVIGAIAIAVRMALRHEAADRAPDSQPTDFVAPESRGAFMWRGPDESPEQFRKRVADARASEPPPPAKGPTRPG
jgi:hypothetical protein